MMILHEKGIIICADWDTGVCQFIQYQDHIFEIHCLEIMTICTKFYVNPLSRCSLEVSVDKQNV